MFQSSCFVGQWFASSQTPSPRFFEAKKRRHHHTQLYGLNCIKKHHPSNHQSNQTWHWKTQYVYIYIYIYMCVCVFIYIYICMCIYIYYMGKFDHERTLFSRALEIMVYVRKIIPFYGRKIQVSEILQFTKIYIYIYSHICHQEAVLNH